MCLTTYMTTMLGVSQGKGLLPQEATTTDTKRNMTPGGTYSVSLTRGPARHARDRYTMAQSCVRAVHRNDASLTTAEWRAVEPRIFRRHNPQLVSLRS